MNSAATHKPWLKRRLWRDGLYRNNTFKSFAMMFSLWLLATLVSGYFMYALAMTEYAEDFEVTMANRAFTLFVFLGLPVLLFYFFKHVSRTWRRWQTWRNCLFKHDAMPAFLGTQLEGELMLPEQLEDGDILSYSLGCFRQRRHQQERVGNKGISLWQSETVKKTLTPGMKSISIQIDLPKSRPESNWFERYRQIKWLLSIKTANDQFEDIDYEVPVFFNPDDI